MNDLIEYEDFLPSVRKSLYGKSHMVEEPNEKACRKLKKVKFKTGHHTPDNIHSSSKLIKNPKSDKLKTRKVTPFKKKLKRTLLQETDDSYIRQPQKLEKDVLKHVKKNKSKKKQVVISFSSSSSSDSFDEELKDILLTPSKSELETFQNTINNSSKRKSCDISDSNSEDDDNESTENFDLEAFLNTHEVSEFNESTTEAHSGIDYEFVSDYAKDVQIMESESMCNHEEPEEAEIVSIRESNKDWIEDNISEVNSDENIESIADKIQESVVIIDDDSQDTSSKCLENSQQEEEISNNYSIAEYHDFEDKKIIILRENQSVPFHGLFSLKVLHGRVEILGAILDKNSNAVNLYSPRGSALLYIQNITQNKQGSNELINISRLVSTKNGLEDIYAEVNCAAVICSKLEDTKLLFLEKYVSQKIFPRVENDNEPQVIFEPSGNLNTIKNNSVWDQIISKVNCDTKLMITGGKGVGKSTLLRFAINRLLNKFNKVRVLDLDPGQSEFTVPGCISIVTVTESILGPNFTHLKQTDRSLLSNINVVHDPRAYIKCVKSIVSHLEMLEGDYPTLINYMGFVQGIGLNIVASAIKYIQPTDIIQIDSKNRNRNFKDDLTYDVVKENCNLFSEDNKIHLNYSEVNYKLHKIQAMNDENDGWALEPRQSREMYVLAYFGQMMRNGVNSLTSHEVPMYEVKLSSIKITNLQGEELAPAVANANLVALCLLEQESNVFICRGYGVIRGIDLEGDQLILITPEQASVLEDVSYLVMGSVVLPPAVYMTPDNVTGVIPYVMEGELVSLGQITKRSYLPVNKK